MEDRFAECLTEIRKIAVAQARTEEKLDGLIGLHKETRRDVAAHDDVLAAISDKHGLLHERVSNAEAIVRAGKWLFPTVAAIIAWLVNVAADAIRRP